MTITSIGAPTVTATDTAAGDARGTGTGTDGFVALVQALLDAGPSGTGTPGGPAQGGVPALPGDPTTEAAAEGDGATALGPSPEPDPAADPALDPALSQGTDAALLSSLVPALVAGLTAPRPATGSPATAAPVAAEHAGAVTGVAAGSSVPIDGATATDTATTQQPAQAAAQPTTQPTGQPVPPASASTAAPTDPATPQTTEAATQPAAATGRPESGADRRPSETQAPAPSTASSTGPSTGLSVAPTTGATAPASTPTTSQAGPVAHQVFPEIQRLTTHPTGPQRVTVRLNPESLGEVRVVLTQRAGGLEVSLSAGSDARRALIEGTPELQRLLDAVGRGDARIVVRDTTGLPVASTAPGTGASTTTSGQAGQPSPGMTWSGDLSGGAGTGAGRSGGGDPAADQGRQHLAGRTHAGDGMSDATNPSRRTQTVTGVRAGLDVTM